MPRDPIKLKANKHRYYLRHREAIRSYNAQYRQRTIEARRQYQTEYYLKHREQRITAVCVRKRSQIKILKNAVYKKYGDKCGRCAIADERVLCIDHVNGGGYRERKEIRSQIPYYKNVLDDTTGKYQLLCQNCNWIKRYEQKETVPITRVAIEREDELAA